MSEIATGTPLSADIHRPQPDLLMTLHFRPGQEVGKEDSVVLPRLQKRGVLHAVSIGPGSGNMAEMFEKDNIEGVIARQEEFLAHNGMSPLKDSFLMLPPKSGEPLVVEVTETMVTDAKNRPLLREDIESDVRAECLYTRVPGVPLLVKPADCPAAIIHAVGADLKPVLGVAHLGRPQVNNHVVEEMVDFLTSTYGCRTDQITIGLTPGIGPEHYTIREEDQREKNLLTMSEWRDNVTTRTTDDGAKVLEVDILGNILKRLTDKHILPTNIQAYGHADSVDTYALAQKNPPEARSNRYANETNQPEKNGRILVAAALPLPNVHVPA